MERSIQQVRFSSPSQPPKALNVAAYARVTSGKDAMLHSLSAQVSFYSNMIQNHEGWRYCGVFSDEERTGTKDTRPGFQKMLEECRAGRIDLIITKAISRFARNTVILLETVRELKARGIAVYFEEQKIHTMGTEGELLMTILASYAQEESRSASENQKWRIKRNFEQGLPWDGTLLGYRIRKGRYEVVPEEAEVIRHIYREYLSGKGYSAIAKGLNEEGVPSRFGGQWMPSVISKVLSNYTYTGNLILQKTYRENHLTKKTLKNKGQLPQYHVEDSHAAIIDMDTFDAVQKEKAQRAEHFGRKPQPKKTYTFTGLLVCGNCGKNYRRKITKTGPVWICATFNTLGKAYCASKQIPEETLLNTAAEVLGVSCCDEETLKSHISKICVHSGNRLVFTFTDGTEAERTWRDRSRAESWTEEMRAIAAEKTRRRYLCQE